MFSKNFKLLFKLLFILNQYKKIKKKIKKIKKDKKDKKDKKKIFLEKLYKNGN